MNSFTFGELKIRIYFTRVQELVYDFFGCPVKTSLWLHTENYLLANSKPIDMILKGRGRKLLKFVNNQIDENRAIGEKEVI